MAVNLDRKFAIDDVLINLFFLFTFKIHFVYMYIFNEGILHQNENLHNQRNNIITVNRFLRIPRSFWLISFEGFWGGYKRYESQRTHLNNRYD